MNYKFSITSHGKTKLHCLVKDPAFELVLEVKEKETFNDDDYTCL